MDAKIKPKYGCLNTTISLHCKQPEVMKIVRAFLHREQEQVCSTGKDDGNNAVYCQPVDKISYASDSCDGKVYCDISVNYSTISDDCRTISPYLTVFYICGKLSNFLIFLIVMHLPEDNITMFFQVSNSPLPISSSLHSLISQFYF